MSFSLNEENTPAPLSVSFTESDLVVALADGRVISTPLAWYPTLMHATAEERGHAELGPFGVYWPDIDEDLSVAGMLAGVIPSYRWLSAAAGRSATESSRQR